MTDLLALPEGTTIQLIGSERGGLLLERTGPDHWAEVSYHCVDCAEDYTNEQAQALVDAAAIDGEPFEVVSVPAQWLSERLSALLKSMDDSWPELTSWVEDDVRAIAIDAGLS